MMPRLLEKYRKEMVPEMMREFAIKNRMAVPRLDKIVVNMGVGEGAQDIKIIEKCMDELAAITGQRPIMRRAKKAIANFKIREGAPIGCKVTLRRAMMYEFMDRLVNIALPRIRDFRGVSLDAFDKAGNYTLGLSEQVIFPEIEYDKLTRTQGMDITFVIKNVKTKDQARSLLKLFGMPFKTGKD
ncbi:MAG: 50S ribosomal protein L5 [Candidatus Omnitrophica bacterium CG08_land_8_20_14_0_20_41_16]|uniref:Large ribosomal subunit protein uL5 n=1 Tax=Candidatus Sherwoodlollariibacterium unditelluris TaxID=1974757 RepID=A0A2G9YJF2_9BACT|nr:MAG: 50S ribosomal protein L5 [Candidatus Omnitrophica bacterium CG23_combo_of_CG06-09_8_20_14_all_41_10]PIS33809.1 MAG: 50S ribosomal protein L5 [Candidatus Omnitrophica bacterium CG08_land_8_20_14_0_20_41_16]